MSVLRIPGVLPGEDGTFQVRHHTEMTSVSRADACHVVVAAIRVGGIAVVVVLRDDVVVALLAGQMELSFSMSHPDAELRATQRAEHHALVL